MGVVEPDDRFDLLTMALLPGLSLRAQRELHERGPLAGVLARPEDHGDLLPAPARALLRDGGARLRARSELARARTLGVEVVGRDDPAYPQLLRQIYDPPLVLYARGQLLPDEGPRSVAVVGSRAASPPGLALGRGMARDLAAAGLTVVSGLARGIDGAAHEGALEGAGRTVAVLGSGLDRMYPPENTTLAARVAAKGAVVSEFPLGTHPARSFFPRRNRVIAGWVRAVVVVEAGARSGALSTARVALEEGREVMAVPGHPSHEGAAGTNQLIRDGAALVRGAFDVLAELGLGPPPARPGTEEDEVLRAVGVDVPRTLDELRERSRRPLPELLARLAELEVADKIRRLPGTLFVRHHRGEGAAAAQLPEAPAAWPK